LKSFLISKPRDAKEIDANDICQRYSETPIITVIGKAFWDVGHAPKDQSNRRKYMSECAVWEIHPVMALHVVQ
jgi:hypothetical protein